jgi:hypothetical protein
MHIEELLKLGGIRESQSPHRLASLIFRNHAEIARGNSRMVFNYKRLNDNLSSPQAVSPEGNISLRVQGSLQMLLPRLTREQHRQRFLL